MLAAMIRFAYDDESLAAILIVEPPPKEGEWIEYISAIRRMNERVKASRSKQRPVMLQIMREGIGMPRAFERRLIAELRREIVDHVVNAVACESAAFRFLGAAFDWIRKPHYVSRWFRNPPEALTFIEGELGERSPPLRKLLEDHGVSLRAPR